MIGIRRFILPGVVFAGLVGSAAGYAQFREGQPPDRKRPMDKERKGDKGPKGDKDRPGPKDRPGDRREPGGERGESRPDPAVESWVRLLTEKMIDPHDTVRDSARAALVAVGPPALPILRRISGSEDSARAVAARKVIAMIESRPGRRPDGDGEPGRPGGPMGPGFGRGPGMGPMGPGGPGFGRGPGMGPMGPGGPGGPMGPGFPRFGGPDKGPDFGGPRKGPDFGGKRDRGPDRDDRDDRRPPTAPPPGDAGR